MQDYLNHTFHEPHVVLFLVMNACVLVPPRGEKVAHVVSEQAEMMMQFLLQMMSLSA